MTLWRVGGAGEYWTETGEVELDPHNMFTDRGKSRFIALSQLQDTCSLQLEEFFTDSGLGQVAAQGTGFKKIAQV